MRHSPWRDRVSRGIFVTHTGRAGVVGLAQMSGTRHRPGTTRDTPLRAHSHHTGIGRFPLRRGTRWGGNQPSGADHLHLPGVQPAERVSGPLRAQVASLPRRLPRDRNADGDRPGRRRSAGVALAAACLIPTPFWAGALGLSHALALALGGLGAGLAAWLIGAARAYACPRPAGL